jgi:hypothetical protein
VCSAINREISLLVPIVSSLLTEAYILTEAFKLPVCQGDVETDLRSSLRKSRNIYTPDQAVFTSRSCLLTPRCEGRVSGGLLFSVRVSRFP